MVQTFAQYQPHHPRLSQGQGHGLRSFRLKFYVKVFRTSFFYLTDEHKFRRAVLSGNRSCYASCWRVKIRIMLLGHSSIHSTSVHFVMPFLSARYHENYLSQGLETL